MVARAAAASVAVFPHPFWPSPAVRENTTHPRASYCCDKMTGDSHDQWDKWELRSSEAGETVGRQSAAEDRAPLIWSFPENELMSLFQNQSLNQKKPQTTDPQRQTSAFFNCCNKIDYVFFYCSL